jgi:hypothetical protein
MNRHAFFTSGLLDGGRENLVSDVATSNDVWGGNPGAGRTNLEVGGWLAPNNSYLPRNWSFSKVDFVMELYQFPQ